MSFGSDLMKAAQKGSERYDKVVRGTLLDLTTRVVKRTPVGNPDLWESKPPPGYVGGQARGNWFASIGQPVTSPDIGKIDKTGASTIVDANQTIELSVGNVWFLTNNLPYIGRLEYEGWSTQAPNGMVRITMSEVNAAIKKAIAQNQR